MKLLSLFLLFYCAHCYAMKSTLPKLKNHPKYIQSVYEKRINSLGKDYTPRTKHINNDGTPIYVNSLILEESPYLLQHAHNPVNWQAWSPKAFKLAMQQNKPIFLSIGYATCHWCHVMEHESFEDIKIAQFINKNFIAIKVDRERRASIDTYYMTGVQMLTGRGGWPMSNFLIPDGKPFFAGTYYNPEQFMNLLSRITTVWKNQEPYLRKQAIQMDTDIKKRLLQVEKSKKIDQSVYSKTNTHLLSRHDDIQGGFSSAPKFPQEPWLLYLLSQNQKDTNQALQLSLNEMQQGGIYDQVGGGFHRYSVDNEWLTPHFEKMLYNQSQLSEVYTQAALEFNNPEYQRTAIAILDYVLREMKSKQGIFYSAGDADSEGEEGLFFTWTVDELSSILTSDEYNWLQNIYQFSKTGNFEQRNILYMSTPLSQIAMKLKQPYSQVVEKLKTINHKLYQERNKRISPMVDNKIITGWNAQMIYSLAYASNTTKKPEYLSAAKTAMQYLLNNHINDKGQLVRNSLNHKASTINAELEDYAWIITALIKLYDETENKNWLDYAKKYIHQTEKQYWDNVNGGFFDNIPENGIPNTIRIKKSEDSATVSANGQMLIALARYFHRTGDLHIEELFSNSMATFSGKVVNYPLSHTSMLRAKQLYDYGELYNLKYAGNGNVRIKAIRNNKKIRLIFSIMDGWHINSNTAMIDSLIPLSITSTNINELNFKYPLAKITKLDFNEDDLSTFEGKFEVITTVSENTLFPLYLNIKLQTCSNKICLPPSKFDIKVY